MFFRIKNEKLCIKNDESCIKSDECWIQNDLKCSRKHARQSERVCATASADGRSLGDAGRRHSAGWRLRGGGGCGGALAPTVLLHGVHTRVMTNRGLMQLIESRSVFLIYSLLV